MDENKQRYYWCYVLVQFFTENHYSSLNILSRNTKKNEREVWMIAMENKEYNIIHIASTNEHAEAEYLNNMCESIEEALNQPVRILNINLFNSETVFYRQAIDSIDLLPNIEVKEHYVNLYPGIDKLLVYSENVDKDIEKTINNTKEIARKVSEERKKKDRIPAGLMFKIVASICVVIFLGINIVDKNYDGANITSISIAFGAYYKTFIVCLKQYYRFLTAGFVHSGLIHLGCNLYALFQIGRIVEKEYGTLKAFIILFAGIIFGNVCVFIINGNIVCYGLSGGINALFGALLAMCLSKGYFKDPGIRNGLLTNLVVNISISLLPNISLVAHLGGLVIGALLGMIFCTETIKSIKINCIISLIIGLIASGFFMYKEKEIDVYYSKTDYQVITLYKEAYLSKGKELSVLEKYYQGEK